MRAWIAGAMLISVLPSQAFAQNAIAGRLPDSSPVAADSVRPAPRLADGRPDLGNGKGSWNPRVIANLAGVGDRSRSPVETVVDVPFQPWARAVYDARQANLQQHDPESRCLPPGIPRLMATPFPFQIFQLSDRVLFVFEGGAHVWRTIFTDGRAHHKDPNPSFLGDAVGRWDGDTLVVDVVGFNEATWLDQAGHPHTEALHVIERFTRTNEATLRYQVTIDDPHAYTAPWTTSYTIPWVAGAELLEYICQENNRDLPHMVGR